MKIIEIKHWRQCDLLKDFFAIRCASTALGETSFGEVIDFLLCALAESEKAREEAEETLSKARKLLVTRVEADELSKANERVAQLEEALIYIGCETDHNKDGRDAPCEICSIIDKALTAAPSALAEVLRAAREFEQAYERGNGRRQSDAKCALLKAVRKYEEESIGKPNEEKER